MPQGLTPRMAGRVLRGSGRDLARFGAEFGEVLGRIWRGSGRDLARFWEGFGEVLGGIWRGSKIMGWIRGCKKMQKKCKKMQIYLHIWIFFCTFAADLGIVPTATI